MKKKYWKTKYLIMVTGNKPLTRKQQQQRRRDVYEYYLKTKESFIKKGFKKSEIYQHIAEVFGYVEPNSVAAICSVFRKKERENN